MRRKMILAFLAVCTAGVVAACGSSKEQQAETVQMETAQTEIIQDGTADMQEEVQEEVQEESETEGTSNTGVNMPTVETASTVSLDLDLGIEENEVKMSNLVKHVCEAALYVEGEEVKAVGILEDYLDFGFTAETDLDMLLESCMVSDEIILKKNGAELAVKVMNPYADSIPLGKCSICYLRTSDTSGTIKGGMDFQCGKATLEDVKESYREPYEENESSLTYRTTVVSFSYGGQEQKVLLEDDKNRDVTFTFANGVLSSIEIKAAALLYSGLQDNMDSTGLEALNRATVQDTIQLRDDILIDLRKIFHDKAIRADINEVTGVVLMDTGVLFDTDESELTEEGKQYLDEMFSAYASVIFEEVYFGKISGIVFEGHTDTNGEYEYNLELSQRRAEAALNYCLESAGDYLGDTQQAALHKMASAKGYSYTNPIFDENGQVDLEKSRRVAIKFYISMGE